MAYLWTGSGRPPAEYLTLILCRDVYHCTPVVLRTVPLADVLPHLECLSIEGRVRKQEEKLARLRSRSRRR